MGKKFFKAFKVVVGSLIFLTLILSVFGIIKFNNKIIIVRNQINSMDDVVERFRNVKGDEVEGDYTIIKGNRYTGKINKHTGEITHNVYSKDGLSYGYTTNFYKNIENMIKIKDKVDGEILLKPRERYLGSKLLPRLNGLYFEVIKNDSGERLYAQNSDGEVKEFYLNEDFRKNLSVREFYGSIADVSMISSGYILLFNELNLLNDELNLAPVLICGVLGVKEEISLNHMKEILKMLELNDFSRNAETIKDTYNEFINESRVADIKFDFLFS